MTLTQPPRTYESRVRPTSRRDSARPVVEPVIFLVLASAAFLASGPSGQFVLTTAVIYSLLAASLGVLLGWSGVYSFGHAAFFGIGAYAAGLLKGEDLSPLLVVLAGAVVAALAAALIGLLGARIVAVQFAMLTLIIGQVVYLLTFKIHVLEGDNGIFGIPLGQIGGLDLAADQNLWWYVVVVVAVLLGVMRRVHLSPYGASLNAVRDDATKAAAIGLPVRALRLSSFTLAGAVAGSAGVLFAQQQGIVTPSTLTFTFSGQILIMVLLGGLHHFWGPPIGAIAFVLLNDQVFGETSHGTLILGVILLVIVVLLPGGLLGAGGWVRRKIQEVRR